MHEAQRSIGKRAAGLCIAGLGSGVLLLALQLFATSSLHSTRHYESWNSVRSVHCSHGARGVGEKLGGPTKKITPGLHQVRERHGGVVSC